MALVQDFFLHCLYFLSQHFFVNKIQRFEKMSYLSAVCVPFLVLLIVNILFTK